MREIRELLLKKVNELLENGTVDRVIGWKAGDFCYDVTPAVYKKGDNFDDFLFDGVCGANQSKYLINETKGEGKVLALLKPCDTYSLRFRCRASHHQRICRSQRREHDKKVH